MGNPSIIAKYKELIKKLFPSGPAWQKQGESNLSKLFGGLAVEPCRIEEQAYKFLEELDPNTTFELLEDWERLLNIPDECTPDTAPTLQGRRLRILQKLTTGGGQSPGFYKLLAEQLGYDVDIIDIEEFEAFRAGESRAGDALYNTLDWAFTWRVSAPAALTKEFRAGQSVAGDRLRLFENDELMCIMEKFKPAHTKVLFAFG